MGALGRREHLSKGRLIEGGVSAGREARFVERG
jgi:hypothetical protein